MRMDKLTARLQEALSDAQSLAVGQGNSTIEPWLPCWVTIRKNLKCG